MRKVGVGAHFLKNFTLTRFSGPSGDYSKIRQNTFVDVDVLPLLHDEVVELPYLCVTVRGSPAFVDILVSRPLRRPENFGNAQLTLCRLLRKRLLCDLDVVSQELQGRTSVSY